MSSQAAVDSAPECYFFRLITAKKYTLFLLSPARLSGKRAALLFDGGGDFIIVQARRFNARVEGYFFDCTRQECLARNAGRQGRDRVPKVGIFATAKRLERPRLDEGFDALYVVKPLPGPSFEVREYQNPAEKSTFTRRD